MSRRGFGLRATRSGNRFEESRFNASGGSPSCGHVGKESRYFVRSRKANGESDKLCGSGSVARGARGARAPIAPDLSADGGGAVAESGGDHSCLTAEGALFEI